MTIVDPSTLNICPMCHQVMQENWLCRKDQLSYWTAEQLKHSMLYNIKEFLVQHPKEPAYFFLEHHKFYTIQEMMRFARLKAFL